MPLRHRAALSLTTLIAAAAVSTPAGASASQPMAQAHATSSHASTTPASTRSLSQRAGGNVSYTNWAGYQADVKAPESIRGTWAVPRANWPGRDGYSAMWVGLGGGTAAQGELVQAGTESDSVCTAATRGHCTKWRTSYYAWIETFPSRAQERVTNLTVAPGDTVEVTVRHSARERRAFFTLCNRRTNDCVATDRTSAAPKGVAEAVLERTSGADGKTRALANVGTPRFSGVSVKGAAGTRAIGRWPNKRVTMAERRATLAAPGALNRSGDSFDVAFRRPA